MNVCLLIVIVTILLLAVACVYAREKWVSLESENEELRDKIIRQELIIKDKDRRIAMLEHYPEPELHYEGIPVYNVSFKVQCLDDTMNETSLKLTLRAMCYRQFKSKAVKITKLKIKKI